MKQIKITHLPEFVYVGVKAHAIQVKYPGKYKDKYTMSKDTGDYRTQSEERVFSFYEH